MTKQRGYYLERVRMNVYMPARTLAKVKALAEKQGTSYSAMATMAIQAGLSAIEMATDPNWKAYFEAKMKEDGDEVFEVSAGSADSPVHRGTNNQERG